MGCHANMCLLALSLALPGCSLITSPDGLIFVDDAGLDSVDAGPDASTDAAAPLDAGDAGDAGPLDAGPCEETCGGERPLCDADTGECVQCLAASDCDDGDSCSVDRCGVDGTCSNTLEDRCLRAMSSGGDSTCAVQATGRVYCWGSNSHGQIGSTAVPVGGMQTRGVWVLSLSDARHVAVGERHACAARAGGEVMCGGDGGAGQIGDGGTAQRRTPVMVAAIGDALRTLVGVSHSCAISTDGTMRCWGNNGNGALGDGSTETRLEPVTVLRLDDFVSGAGGLGFTCATRTTGGAACWGWNLSGALGDGTMGDANRPIDVSGLSDAVDVSSTAVHSCALRANGRVACWGDNGAGQLGDGTKSNSNVPVEVSGLSDAIAVSVGASHSCALTADGTVYCWGANESGQLGTGAAGADVTTPVSVAGLGTATSISTGTAHSCAQVDRTDVFCWGDNSEGQIGDDTTEQRLTPTRVRGL